MEERSIDAELQVRGVVNSTHARFLDRVDLEGSETGANFRWSNPFLAGDCGAGIRRPRMFDSEQARVLDSGDGEEKSDKRSERASEQLFKEGR